MRAQISVTSGMDWIGNIQIGWNDYGSKWWKWKYSPDGYKYGVWSWARDFRPPVQVRADWAGLPSFKGYCMILTCSFYRTADDAILNPTKIVYEPYLFLYSDIWWEQGTLNPLEAYKPWFSDDDGPRHWGRGAIDGLGIVFFKEKNITRVSPVTGQKEPSDWPRSGIRNIMWMTCSQVESEAQLGDPYAEWRV